MNKWILLIAMICGLVNLSAQEIESVRNRRDFTDYYFSPMKISRDHPLHASIFQIPLYSARSLANDTGILGASFEYTSIESSYTNNTFEYDFEGAVFTISVSSRNSRPSSLLFCWFAATSGLDIFSCTSANRRLMDCNFSTKLLIIFYL